MSRSGALKKFAVLVAKQIRTAHKHKIPMLPGVAARAMEIAARDDVSIRELESIILPDPVISARALSIASSSLYGARSPVTSLHQAIMMLGIDTMRDILYQTVVEAHIFRGDREEYLRDRRIHSVAVAYLARDVEKLMTGSCSMAFLCGLMHDLGDIIVHQILSENPPEGLAQVDIPWVCSMIHTKVGGVMARRWKLPEEIYESITRHHRYEADAELGLEYSPIGNMICAADRLAQHAGLLEGHATDNYLELGGEDSDRKIFADLGIDLDSAHGLLDRAHLIKQKLVG